MTKWQKKDENKKMGFFIFLKIFKKDKKGKNEKQKMAKLYN